MDQPYEPKRFWVISLSIHRGMYKNIPNALVLMVPAAAAVVLHHYGEEISLRWELDSFGSIMTPFTTLVGLLTTFRVNDAFNRYKTGRGLVEVVYTKSCEAVMRLTAALECNEETEELVLRVRRLMILGVLLVQKHTHEEKLASTKEEVAEQFAHELRTGLITADELEQMTQQSLSVAVGIDGKPGKKDRFPSKNRPRFAWFLMNRALWELNQKGVFKTVHYHFQTENCMYAMASAFDEMLTLSQTLLPIQYAQVSRFVALVFLLLLPFAMIEDLGYVTLPICFIANTVYLTVDSCASEMENPFGNDETDIDMRKLVRQTDKHTASIMGLWMGRPCPNYDINPEDAKLVREGKKPSAVVRSVSSSIMAVDRMREAASTTNEKTGLIGGAKG